MTWTIFAWILIFNTIAAASLAWVLRSRKIHKPGSQMMMWMFISLSIWTFGYAMITFSPSLQTKLFWLRFENIGIVSTPVFWFLFASEYTKLGTSFTKVKFIFFLIPAITLGMLFSESTFHLYYISTTPYAQRIAPLIVKGGMWYRVQLLQSYLLIAVGVVLLFLHIFTFRENYKKRVLTVLAAIAVPVALNAFYHISSQLFPSVFVHVDLAPITFTITAGLINKATFGLRLFDMTPIARHIVLDNLSEMVIVVDGDGLILDANRTALNWLEKKSKEVIGKNISDIFTASPELAHQYQTSDVEKQNFTFIDTKKRAINITVSPIYNQVGSIEGRVIVANDITQRESMEKDLRKANKELKEKLKEIKILQAQLKEQAIRDPLTGLFNRRYLAEALDSEISRARRDNSPLSAVIMDVDHFKKFNDKYGHKCGDYVLQHLSNLLLKNTRRGDTVCRYGGEEFVIIMPKVTHDIAFSRAETWRKALENTTIHYDGKDLSVKFSAGVACFPFLVKSGEDLLKAADQALYQSKANGRNLVTLYAETIKEAIL